MKRSQLILITAFLSFIFSLTTFAQDKAQTVYSIRVVHHDNDWYLDQIKAWENELERNPKSANAWFNYYKAHRYANFAEAKFSVNKIEKFNQILAEMEQEVPQSFEFALLQYIIKQCDMESEASDFTWLEEAYRRDPERTETYDEFISRYEVHEPNPKKLEQFCDRWYQSEEIPSFLLDYNYNVLVSADDNAIIFTNGDNDTYPLWLLQQVKDIRRDVSVLNIHLIKGYPTYLVRKLKEKGIAIDRRQLPDSKSSMYLDELSNLLYELNPAIKLYYVLTLHHSYIEPLKDKLFLTGLVNQYSPKGMDNFALLKRNILKHYRLDYLNYNWYHENHLSAQLITYLNANYVMPFIKLAEHLYLSGDKLEAHRLKQMALNLAQKANIAELINLIKEKNFNNF
jgi:hypothetical protein